MIYNLKKATAVSSGDVPAWSEGDVRGWAREILGVELDALGCAPCPGGGSHSTRSGVKDFRVFFEGAVPAARCVHGSCGAAVAAFNKELWRRLFGQDGSVKRDFYKKGKAAVKAWDKKRKEYDEEALRKVQRLDLVVDGRWLRERSPVDPVGCSVEVFLDSLYGPEDRVLVFCNEFSQGDYGYRPGGGWVKLGQDRAAENRKVVEGPVAPAVYKNGVWFLAQPVSGKWVHNASYPERPWSRRRADAVRAWRYMVLESDDAPVELWLNALVQWRLPVAALYTSGGRSVHALLRVDQGSKGAWDNLRDAWQPVLTRLGGDGGSLSAVRLTRLPGCLRGGVGKAEGYVAYDGGPRLQELLYLNPRADLAPILSLPVVRVVEGGNLT